MFIARIRRVGAWVLAGALCGTGCATTQLVLPPELLESCQTVPCGCRDHVYLFFLTGLDPRVAGNFAEFRTRVEEAGFRRVYSGCLHNLPEFACEIHSIRKEDPHARIILIGCGLGCSAVKSVVRDARLNGMEWIGAFTLDGPLSDDAPNAPGNLGAVEDPTTLSRLLIELAEVAKAVPYQAPLPFQPRRGIAESPTPRPVLPQQTVERDEWDFLKPVSLLRPLPTEPVERVVAKPAEE